VGQDINVTDENGMRQGFWQITGKLSAEEGYRDNQIVEEGVYENNRKTGVWKKYYPTGSLKNEITFVNNYPRGPYKTYYPNGNLEEEGNWQSNKNIGDFKRYHRNGKLAQDFHFLSNGKRDGTQNYFYENGKPQLEVDVKNGVVNGFYKTYYPDGGIKTEKAVRDGVVVEGSVVYHEAKKGQLSNIEIPSIPEQIRAAQPEETVEQVEVKAFEESGTDKLYNHRKQVTQDGVFKNGRLWDGKWHRYDSEGNLTKIEVYKDGKFAGYASLENTSK
jgi:antitoxin component YwqK of YwqJK toxin-antitoxin module